MLLFIVKTPKRHFLGRKRAVWALNGRRTTRGATGTLSEEYKKKYKKGSPECTAKIWVVAQTPPVNRSLPNFACGFVSRMCFLVLSFRKIGWKMWERWGSKFRPSHWKGTSLIQQLVATAQAAQAVMVVCIGIALLIVWCLILVFCCIYGNCKCSFLPGCTCCLCHIVHLYLHVLCKLNDDDDDDERPHCCS